MHGQQPNQSTTDRADRPDADGAGRWNGSRERAPRARHQLVLREVNERISELVGNRNEIGVSLFVCECSDPSCTDAVEISAAEYARIRADKSCFVVLPGHERPDSERVVENTGHFVVVANRELEEAQASIREEPTP
ncbi:MAG TPA: hypothetical protein VFB17_03930 [Gaiellaceae bacterium]|nr:hypothetical protein [Gaiellaceae bacterium]